MSDLQESEENADSSEKETKSDKEKQIASTEGTQATEQSNEKKKKNHEDDNGATSKKKKKTLLEIKQHREHHALTVKTIRKIVDISSPRDK